MGPRCGLSASLESLGFWALFFLFHVASGWAFIVGTTVLGPFCVMSSLVGTDGVFAFVSVMIAVNGEDGAGSGINASVIVAVMGVDAWALVEVNVCSYVMLIYDC